MSKNDFTKTIRKYVDGVLDRILKIPVNRRKYLILEIRLHASSIQILYINDDRHIRITAYWDWDDFEQDMNRVFHFLDDLRKKRVPWSKWEI